MRLILAGLLCLSACAAPAARSTVAPAVSGLALSAAEAVVQAQLEAYNRRDVEAFAATYAPDVRIYDHPDRLQMSGVDQLRDTYSRFFASAPGLRASVTRRIVQGDHVIDHETVTGLPGGAWIQAVAVYQVRDGRIQNVWFIR